jgi:hypothetical protein
MLFASAWVVSPLGVPKFHSRTLLQGFGFTQRQPRHYFDGLAS